MDKAPELSGYPLFDISDTEAALGCDIARYIVNFHDLERRLPKEAKVAEMLFFRGGILSDYGFDIKPGLDRAKVR